MTATTTETELRQQLAVLEQRLIKGWTVIDRQLAEGRDVAAAEEKWLGLLADYERLYARLHPEAIALADRIRAEVRGQSR